MPQRPIEINDQIIEAARAKNAQHYYHSSLQHLNKTPLINEDTAGDATRNAFEGLIKAVNDAKSPATAASAEPGRTKKTSKEALHKQSHASVVYVPGNADTGSKLIPNSTVQGQSTLSIKQGAK